MASWENRGGSFWPTWQENKLFVVLLAVLLVGLIGLVCASAGKIGREARTVGYGDQLAPTISVSATGSADVTLDIATTDVSVTKQGATATEAQDLASVAMNTVIADMKALGIPEADLRTSSFSTNQVFDYDVSPAKLTGYESQQTLTIKIRDTALVSKVLDAAPKSGATSVSGIRYEVDDDTATVNAARDEAVAKAETQAKTIARSLHTRLGKVVSYSESQDGGILPYLYGMGGGDMKLTSESAASTVEVGQNTIEMTVYITYSLN